MKCVLICLSKCGSADSKTIPYIGPSVGFVVVVVAGAEAAFFSAFGPASPNKHVESYKRSTSIAFFSGKSFPTRRFFKSCCVLLDVVSFLFRCEVERCVDDDDRENDEPIFVKLVADNRYIFSKA